MVLGQPEKLDPAQEVVVSILKELDSGELDRAREVFDSKFRLFFTRERYEATDDVEALIGHLFDNQARPGADAAILALLVKLKSPIALQELMMRLRYTEKTLRTSITKLNKKLNDFGYEIVAETDVFRLIKLGSSV